MTFEQYLKQYGDRLQEYRLVATVNEDGHVSFYIHPIGRDGGTPVYAVTGNALSPIVTEPTITLAGD